jgi:hypothetical protein
VAALALPLVLATGCGDDSASTADDPDPTPTTSSSPSPSESETTTAPPTEPQCSEIWVDGQKFPERYRGCFEGSEKIQAESVYCEFGTKLFFYANSFYAVPNGPVNETDGPLAKDDSFKTALNKCGG